MPAYLTSFFAPSPLSDEAIDLHRAAVARPRSWGIDAGPFWALGATIDRHGYLAATCHVCRRKTVRFEIEILPAEGCWPADYVPKPVGSSVGGYVVAGTNVYGRYVGGQVLCPTCHTAHEQAMSHTA